MGSNLARGLKKQAAPSQVQRAAIGNQDGQWSRHVVNNQARQWRPIEDHLQLFELR